MSAAEEVLSAAADLVAAFGRHDTDAYFAHFSPDATFCFYTADRRLDSRADYERLWRTWEVEDGFRVRSCTSTDARVQMLGDVAVFTHEVRTEVETTAGSEELSERETIVFARSEDDRWVAVHEHLSPVST